MDSKKRLGRVISALLAASSVVGQAGAAARRPKPKSAPVVARKDAKKKDAPDGVPFWKRLHKDPHNWAHFVLGGSTLGLGGYLLWEKLNGVKGGADKLNKLYADVMEDSSYSAFADVVGKLLSVSDEKESVADLFGGTVPKSGGLIVLEDDDLKGCLGEFKFGSEFGKGYTLGCRIDDSQDMNDIFPSYGVPPGRVIFVDGTCLSAIVSLMGYSEALANLVLKKGVFDVCVKKGLFKKDSVASVNVENDKVVAWQNDGGEFVKFLSSCAEDGNKEKVKEVWDKLSGQYLDLLSDIIESKLKAKKGKGEEEKKKGEEKKKDK